MPTRQEVIEVIIEGLDPRLGNATAKRPKPACLDRTFPEGFVKRNMDRIERNLKKAVRDNKV